MYITSKLQNWINHATKGQREVLVEARDELENVRFALKYLHDQVEAYYPGFYEHPSMRMAREYLTTEEDE